MNTPEQISELLLFCEAKSDKELGLLTSWQQDIYNQALMDLRNSAVTKLQEVQFSAGQHQTWDFVAGCIKIVTDKANALKK